MEKTLAEPLQRALLAQVLEQMPAGVIIASPDGHLLLANAEAERIWKHAIFGSTNIADFAKWKGFHPDGRPLLLEEWPLARSLQKGEVVEGEEIGFERGDGTTGVMRVSSSPIYAKDGTIAAGVVTFFDVTERTRLLDEERRARAEAEQASRAKDDFLAILSHEMRTPMTTVIGWADFLKMTHGEDTSIGGPVESLRASARAQARLVDDLLDVSRIVTGKLRIEPRETDLAEIVRAAAEEVLVSAETKGIRIEARGLHAPLPVCGDPDRLRQVFTNLLTNAVKFTPGGGKVSIEAERKGSVYTVSVEDDGEGISSDFLPHVFDRFRQASIGDSRRHSGLGLGLSIVQHLVHLHGGTVQAESDGIGKGAKFTVELPAG